MRLKLDENLPQPLADALADLGHDVDTVASEGLSGCDDDAVWAAAQEAGRLLITQDMDFSDLRRFFFEKHAGILLLRLREPKWRSLVSRVTAIFETEDVDQWAGCLVVAMDRKIRVRRTG